MQRNKRVAILGASEKPERFAYKAFRLLRSNGFEALPVNPRLAELEGERVFRSVREIEGSVGTITLYVGPALSQGMTAELVEARPRRVIFNPGSENPALARALVQAGIEVVEDCTLVMLRSHSF